MQAFLVMSPCPPGFWHRRWTWLALWAMLGIPVAAQSNNDPASHHLVLNATVGQTACNFTPSLVNENNPLVVSLPPLQTTVLLESPFSPVAPVQLRIQLSDENLSCLKTVMGNKSNPIVFDSDFAAVQSRSGLLRNSASNRPAQNVLVQLGLINEQGIYTPLDLNQPQALNQALTLQSAPNSTNLILNLGVRYVAARFVTNQYAAFGNATSGVSDVTAGNVSVLLPFLLTLK